MKIVVIGGGMAGMSAAQAWAERGHHVTLYEQSFCGSQASGKSSGFITPESELNLVHWAELVGESHAKEIWDFGQGGCDLIRENITKYKLDCAYRVQDSCVTATSQQDFEFLKKEHELRTKMGYASKLITKTELPGFVNTDQYYGGLWSTNTFGINSYQYLQGMKQVLTSQGVTILEETPVKNINDLRADPQVVDNIIVCVDRFIPDLHLLERDIYHAQNFILLSKPLTQAQITQLFPAGELMVWDTDLLYCYYRIAHENRFLLGGGDYLSIFWGSEQPNNQRVRNKLINYAQQKFPQISWEFEYFWPGLIGVSKDIMPIAGHDPRYPNVYCIAGTAGLPWAAALGRYSAHKILDGKTLVDKVFSPQRKYPLPNWFQSIFGKRITFALSNALVELW